MTHANEATQSETVTRIVIVDDHPIVRDGLIAVLSNQPGLEVCGEAAGIVEAMTVIDALNPDLAIIDLSLADGSGIDLIKRVRARGYATRMLVLSMNDEAIYAERSLRAGAMGYLHKQEARGKLLDAIHHVLGGQYFVSSEMSNQLIQQIQTGRSPLTTDPVQTLSDRELEIFGLIGHGYKTQEIADRLHLGMKTIQTHRDRIKGKLNLKNGAELTHQATRWALENQ